MTRSPKGVDRRANILQTLSVSFSCTWLRLQLRVHQLSWCPPGPATVVEVELATWPDCPSNSGVAQGFNLIPVSVSGEGVQVGVGVEQKEEKEELETPRSDMV